MNKEKRETKLKIRFYFMSLWLLFLLITIVTIRKPEFTGDETLKEIIILSKSKYYLNNIPRLINYKYIDGFFYKVRVEWGK